MRPVVRPAPPATGRRLLVLLLASLMVVVPVRALGEDPSAAAGPDDEAAFVAAINAVRADVGLPALTVSSELTALARAHAQLMADATEIFHADPISAGLASPWQKLGENVGVGADVAVLMDAFVSSPGHYANIVDPDFTEVGVGVVWNGNALYTTHRFLQRPVTQTPTSTTLAPPATATTPTTQPAAVSEPTTQPAAVSEPTAPPPTGSPTGVSAGRIEFLLALLDLLGT